MPARRQSLDPKGRSASCHGALRRHLAGERREPMYSGCSGAGQPTGVHGLRPIDPPRGWSNSGRHAELLAAVMSQAPTPNRLSTPSDPVPTPTGLWGKTVAFLNRDVTSFLPGTAQDGSAEADRFMSPSAQRDDLPVESLVDLGKLQGLAFRRAVLDWRDNFQQDVTLMVSQCQDALVQKMDADLGNISLLRRVVTQSAESVLQEDFVALVRVPLRNFLFEQEGKLAIFARQWGLPGTFELVFSTHSLQQECAVLRDVGFKPSNRALICARLHSVLMERVGIADGFREQAHRLSRQLLEAHESC